jgi:hypothetical protein
MHKKIGFVVASTLFLIVVLSTTLAFGQTYDYVEIDTNAEDLVRDYQNGILNFTVIEPFPGYEATITATAGQQTYTWDLEVDDKVELRYSLLSQDDITFSATHLVYQGPADSVTINAVEIPEFSSFLILPLFMMATLLGAVVLRRKLTS